MIVYYFVVAIGAFMVGSIPFSWILGRYGAGIDLLKTGSGNPGATNLYRSAGWKWGIPALLLDAAKGFVPVLISRAVFPDTPGAAIVAATAAIAGHVWTPFLRFKGGKGVATAAGTFLALNPWLVLTAVVVFVVIVALTRYVSVGSIVGVLVAFAGSFLLPLILGKPISVPFVVFCGVCAAVIVFAHRKNIRRVLKGEESKWGKDARKP
jgi:glycerol-3-phosphate acyltransferase PlsY